MEVKNDRNRSSIINRFYGCYLRDLLSDAAGALSISAAGEKGGYLSVLRRMRRDAALRLYPGVGTAQSRILISLFEETGRYLAFSFALKKYRAKNVNALMYGAGHGGFEAIVIAGFTMINNIIWSVMINNGSISSMISSLPGDQAVQAQQSVTLLTTMPSYQFLLSGVERLSAIALHIALSVIVWFAVKWNGKLYLYPMAILIHFAVDATAAILSRLGVNVILIEIVVAVLTAAAALFARRLWRETM